MRGDDVGPYDTVDKLWALVHQREADLARVRAALESAEFAIRDAIHELPDKGADALVTLRAALEGR